jgi:hypothetical protein
MELAAGFLNNRPPRWTVNTVLLLTLMGGCSAKAGPMLEPFLLNCRLNDGSRQTMRIDPRLQQIQELDPATGEVTSTITTYEPPAELGGGIIDDSTVKITDQQIYWDKRMYRPQQMAELHSIQRQTLAYQVEWKIQRDDGPDIEEQTVTGTCQRIDKLP